MLYRAIKEIKSHANITLSFFENNFSAFRVNNLTENKTFWNLSALDA